MDYMLDPRDGDHVAQEEGVKVTNVMIRGLGLPVAPLKKKVQQQNVNSPPHAHPTP